MKNIIVIICYLVISSLSIKANAQFVNNGNFNLNSGANIGIFGDFINNGTILDSGTVVVFAGTANQSIAGTSITTFNNLSVNNSSGITLNQTLNASNNLTLTSGKVNLNGFNFTLGYTGHNGTIAGGGSTSYLISGNANSKLTRFSTTASSYNFPVGDANNYTPMSTTIVSSGVSSTSKLTVDVIASMHPLKGTATNFISRYWTLIPTNIQANTLYNVTYTYSPGDIVGVEANLFPCKYNTAGWLATPSSGSTNVMGTGNVNPGTHTAEWNGLYSFSDFTAFGNGSPLPISLLNFDAYPILENVQITWSTVTQTNNDYFTVERSLNGINYSVVGQIKGAGNSNEKLDYLLIDTMPYNGISYYRLKQTDFDGKFTYSSIKDVSFKNSVSATGIFSVYPNPTNLNGIYFETGERTSNRMEIKLTDMAGTNILEQSIIVDQNGDKQFLPFNQTAPGIYNLTVTDYTTSKTIKLIVGAVSN